MALLISALSGASFAQALAADQTAVDAGAPAPSGADAGSWDIGELDLEALRAVPGINVSWGRDTLRTGVRGLSFPGDVDTRLLVLIDGHPMNNPWNAASNLGELSGYGTLLNGDGPAVHFEDMTRPRLSLGAPTPTDGLTRGTDFERGGERALDRRSGVRLGAGALHLLPPQLDPRRSRLRQQE